MLPEPFSTIVQAYITRGGQVLTVPFGISGKVYGFRELSVVYGMRGWVERFGVRHVPQDSVPFILAGQLSVPAARAELVWDLVRAQDGRATITALSRSLGLSRPCIEAVLDLLERAGAVRRVAAQHPAPDHFTTSGPAPRWSDFLRDEQRAA